MKFVAFIIGLMFIAPFSASAKTAPAHLWTTYGNSRFEYFIDFPSDILTAQPEAENGDGRLFFDKSRTTKMTVFASYNAMEKNFADFAKEERLKCKNKPSYELKQADMFVISCKIGSKILYQKSFYQNETFYNFYIEYPENQKAKWNTLITRISKSFKIM